MVLEEILNQPRIVKRATTGRDLKERCSRLTKVAIDILFHGVVQVNRRSRAKKRLPDFWKLGFDVLDSINPNLDAMGMAYKKEVLERV
ncbi:hypothetical protein [Absidia glauca]|uniref:Uncharacterized protein n=1 Tax=Absidia glauca TaxID=4829 RepID=A0A163JQ68_ABSGL|nr:hypothetical protein [Absidia glauca]